MITFIRKMYDDDNSAAWGAAAQLTSEAATVSSQARTNKKERQFVVDQMNQQRAWAVQDWDKQNAYNLPQNQMARLKAAGLNPNLVYGHGADSVSTVGIRATPQGSWSPKAPDYSPIGNVAGNYFDLQMKQQTLNNMAAQNTLTTNQAALVAAQIPKTESEGQSAAVDATVKSALEATSIEVGHENLRQLSQKIDTDMGRYIMDVTKFPVDYASAVQSVLNKKLEADNIEARTAEAKQRVAVMQQQVGVLKNTQVLQDQQIKLQNLGLTWHDEYWQRAAALAATNVYNALKDGKTPSWIPQQQPGPSPDFTDDAHKSGDPVDNSK